MAGRTDWQRPQPTRPRRRSGTPEGASSTRRGTVRRMVGTTTTPDTGPRPRRAAPRVDRGGWTRGALVASSTSVVPIQAPVVAEDGAVEPAGAEPVGAAPPAGPA